MKHIALLGCLCLLAGGCSQPAEVPEPIPVIFDTDPGNDIDDVLALQMLLNYHKETCAASASARCIPGPSSTSTPTAVTTA